MTSAQKGKEYLEKLKQRDTKQQLATFMDKKKQFSVQTFKQRYISYMRENIINLNNLELNLYFALDFKQPSRPKNPSLKEFFALQNQEMELEMELSQMYSKINSKVASNLVNEAVNNPSNLIQNNRSFSLKEYVIFIKAKEQLKEEAQKLLLLTQTVMKNDIPISTATYQHFNKFDFNCKPVADAKENFYMQIANICLIHEIKVGEKVSDIYAEAFKLQQQKIDVIVGQMKDKIRQNIQIKNSLADLQQKLIQLNHIVENPIFDDEIDDEDVFSAESLENQLSKIMNQQSKTSKVPTTEANTIPTNSTVNSLTVNEEAIKKRVQQETEREIQNRSQLLKSQLNQANAQASQVYRQQINKLGDIKTDLKNQQILKQKQEIENEKQRRIRAAENDALMVKPEAKIDPERLYRETQVILNRKTQNIQLKTYKDGLGRGQYDFKVQGEHIIADQPMKQNNAVSFDVMQKLADKGLLGTQAGRDAVQGIRNGEMQARFQGWALRDDVKRLFG
ncbi:Conserved_hypothetical protein [Hexamita inflata]|uniref:Uncharacterized protein n=1 Tax=Hexamita inflata TaxID=28002 RepID=A0AA86N9L4_9EUKA|nr:Conserved hypothetical protein [Hexamita inflata]